MDVLLVLAVLALAIFVISGPLRAGLAADGADGPEESPERAELEAAKDTKLREIRESELDYRTGKLSAEDWRNLDAELRAEAIELLKKLDALE